MVGFAGELAEGFHLGDFLGLGAGFEGGGLFFQAEEEDGDEAGADEGDEEGDDGPEGEVGGAAA